MSVKILANVRDRTRLDADIRVQEEEDIGRAALAPIFRAKAGPRRRPVLIILVASGAIASSASLLPPS